MDTSAGRILFPGVCQLANCLAADVEFTRSVANIAEKLLDIQTSGFAGWEDVLCVISVGAFAYERDSRSTGLHEVQALLRTFTVHRLATGGKGFPHLTGLHLPHT